MRAARSLAARAHDHGVLAMAEQPIPTPPEIDDARVDAKLRALVLECLRGDPRERPKLRAVLAALA